MPIAQYVAQWTEDLDWVGQYDVATLRDEVWPWLLGRGYARATDDLDGFCQRLGNRPAFLRPGIAIRRIWPIELAEDLDDRRALVPQVRDGINQALTLLEEPLLPHPGTG
jgi:hypothetical protein